MANENEIGYALGILNATVADAKSDKDFEYIESANRVVIKAVSDALDNRSDVLDLNQLNNIANILNISTLICEKISARRMLGSASNALKNLIE